MPSDAPPSYSNSCAPPISTSAFRRSTISLAAIAEDHSASILHYDADFERLAANTDLATTVEALSPLGSMP